VSEASETGSRPETLVMIPARGGSKGVPGKNIVDIGGKPLIAYSIEAALKSQYVSRVIVSTDSEEIAAISREYGAEVPFLRPAALAGDNTPLQSATNHCLQMLTESGYHADIHCILLPPHLFRQPRLINEAVELVLQGWHNVHTVRPIDVVGNRYFQLNGSNLIQEVKAVNTNWPVEPRHYRMYGSISVFAPGLPTVGSIPIELTNPIEFIDIDTPADVELAREVLRLKLYDFDVQ
jgi:CMP-N-acetylneuraminic acid synthetase